jgi:HEAT repeats
MRRRWFLLWVPSLLAGVVGCHPQPRRAEILVSRVVVSDSTLSNNGALEISPEELKQHLVTALDSVGRYRPLPPEQEARKDAPSSYLAKVELTFTRESDEPPSGGAPLRRAEVALSLTLSPSHTDGEENQLRAVSSASRLFDPAADKPSTDKNENPRLVAFRAALDQALQRAAFDLLLQADAAGKTEPQLVADLASPDAGVRDSAVRQLSERKSPAAVPALIERLKDPDREVVLRTLGALQEIRDPRAVRPLIDLTDRQDPAFVAQVIYVIGDLGGPEAEAFLFTLQNGSPDPQVRVAAAEASQTLRRKRDALQGDKAKVAQQGKPNGGL